MAGGESPTFRKGGKDPDVFPQELERAKNTHLLQLRNNKTQPTKPIWKVVTRSKRKTKTQ